MKKNTNSKPWRLLSISVFIATFFSVILVSCKDNSTSSNKPDEPDNFEVCGDTAQDNDGNSYKTVQIGNQCWMAEDLRTTSYRDGTSIPNVTENNEWTALTTGAWAYYANDDFNSDINGKLYNWFAVNDSRGLCPTDWKMPSDDEWKTLEIELGMTVEEANSLEWRGSSENIREKMQAESGFSADLGGSRAANGAFSSGGRNGVWWSSSEVDATTAWTRFIRFEFDGVYRSNSNKSNGSSARCLLN